MQDMKEKWSNLERKANEMSSVFDTEYELSKIILAPDKVEQRKKVSPMKTRNNKNQT